MANFLSNYDVVRPVEVITQGTKEMKFIPDDMTFDKDLIEYCTPYWNSLAGAWDRSFTHVYMYSGNSFVITVDYPQFASTL